jgi:hypothetical protein
LPKRVEYLNSQRLARIARASSVSSSKKNKEKMDRIGLKKLRIIIPYLLLE